MLGNGRASVAETESLLAPLRPDHSRLADEVSYELMGETKPLQEHLDHRDAWYPDARLEQAIDALRCWPHDAYVKDLSSGE